MVEREAIAVDANPLERVHRAVRLDQRHIAVVRDQVLRDAGVDDDVEVACRVVTDALGEAKAAVGLDVGATGERRAGNEWLIGGGRLLRADGRDAGGRTGKDGEYSSQPESHVSGSPVGRITVMQAAS